MPNKVNVQKNAKPSNRLINKIHNKSDDPALEKRLGDTLQKLYSFHDQEIDMSLERVTRFLHQLGDPHLNLPPVIHVAGTNGKGSTIAILRSLLEASGKSVHVMTSPHLIHPTERIRLAGELISTPALIDVLEECLAINHAEPITFFEMFTAATYLAMSRTPADFVLLETGMGGRLDATNVIPNPLCTIITTISKDHEDFLGSTLEKIAFEKAGIIKAGVPCITGYQTNEALESGIQKVFHEISQSLSPKAKLIQYGAEWNIETVQGGMNFTWYSELITTNAPNLIGEHQIYNAGAALAAYRVIMGEAFDPNILSPENQNNPLRIIHWPGRLQKLESTPLTNILAEGYELWLDGGHNDSAGLFLAKQANAWQEQDDKPLHLIIAMINRKDPKAFLKPLLPYIDSLTLMTIEGEDSSLKTDELYALIDPLVKPLGIKNIRTADTIENAALQITANNKPARILATGSLYFIGTILT